MSKKCSLSVAIDFGTTYSGYAFQFLEDYENDPLKIYTYNWKGGKEGNALKTPTCVLLHETAKNNFEVVNFGHEAEDQYAHLKREKKTEDYYFFKHFKMQLYKKGLSENTILNDVTGKKVDALKVFSLSIFYIKQKFEDHIITSRGASARSLLSNDVSWQITIPAIWSDSAKQFMRRAAEMAGLPRGPNLKVALEPEAASLYCRVRPTNYDRTGGEASIVALKEGTVYMVLDIGGGTADITVHEVLKNDKLKEIYGASGGPWGGMYVNKKFHEFMEELFSPPIMHAFRNQSPTQHLSMDREFETKKKSFSEQDAKKFIYFEIPKSLARAYEAKTNKDIETVADGRKDLTFADDSIGLEGSIMLGFFEKSVSQIIKHVEGICNDLKSTSKISYMLMVGGYSESPILRNRVISEFSNVKVITPDDPQIAVAKGAALVGHKDDFMSARRLTKTYGVEVSVPFKENIHDKDLLFYNKDGEIFCADTFDIYFSRGELVEDGQKTEPRDYFRVNPNSRNLYINIYTSNNTNPVYTREAGVEPSGKIVVEMPGDGVERKVRCSMIAGGTEIKVLAVDADTGKDYVSYLDFLSE